MADFDLDSIIEEMSREEPETKTEEEIAELAPNEESVAVEESVSEPEELSVTEEEGEQEEVAVTEEDEQEELEVEKPVKLLERMRRKVEETMVIPAQKEEEPVKTAPPARTLPPEEAVTRMVDLGLSAEDLQTEEEEEDASLEEALQESRRKQLEHFRKNQESVRSPIRLVGEEEERNDPEEEPEEVVVPEDPTELNSYEDAKPLFRELRFRRTTGLAVTALAAILELILTALSLVAFLAGGIQTDVMAFLVIQLVLFGMLMAGCHSVIGDGMKALLHGTPTNESPAALVSLLVLIHTVLQFFAPYEAALGQVELLTSVAGLQLFLCALSRQKRLGRVSENLKMTGQEKMPKYAARPITDAKTATLIGHNAVAAGNPVVSYFKKASFLKNFIAYSLDRDYNEPSLMRLLPVGGGVAAAMTVLYCLLGKEISWLTAVSVFVGTFSLAMPTVGVVSQTLMQRAARAVRQAGGMLSGQVAVDEFGDIDGLAVDAVQLFAAQGSIQLLGIKTFEDAQIDTAILDAAAVCIKAASPLGNVFRQVIEDREDYLQEVDTLVYEQDMGISGWVGGRRVLVGSRQLLQNHGVDVPSGDYESRYAVEDRKLVYLSTAGKLTAMFVLNYHANAVLAKEIRRLNAQGVSLLIRSCDPNITEELVCERFGLDEYYVEILPSIAGSAYVALTENEVQEEEAVLASDGRLTGMVRSISLCHILRRFQSRLAVWQAVGSVLAAVGYGLLAVLSGALLPTPLLLLFLLVWTVVPTIFGTLRIK